MSTGQKYSGKGEPTTQNEAKGSTNEQSAENATPAVQNQDQPQAAETTGEPQPPVLPPNTLTFEELAIFDSMLDASKGILLHLAHAESYQPAQLKQAFIYLSQTPGVTSIEDEGLQAALVKPTPSVDETAPDKGGDPILVELPYFLRCQIRDTARAKNLFAAIGRVFLEFERTREVEDSEEWFNQTLAYAALRLAFVEIVEKAAKERGTYEKSDISDYLHSTPDLSINDEELDNAPVLVSDPADTTDVERLQEWVGTLQRMCRLQQKINATLTKQRTIGEKITATQDKLIAELHGKIEVLEQVVEKQKSKKQEVKIANSQNYVDLTLYLSEGIESEVELVRFLLSNAARDMQKGVLRNIATGETEDAFFLFEDYNRLLTILDRLATETVTVASDNHVKAYSLQNPQLHTLSVDSDLKRFFARKAEFIKDYAVSYDDDSDEEEEQPVEPQKPNEGKPADPEQDKPQPQQ